MSWWRGALAAVVVALGSWGGVASAAGTKVTKLPSDYVFPQGDGSPGKVTFSHGSHVDTGKPVCTTCHPRNFRILQAGRDFTGEPLRHQRMEAGAACGACHGKAAFGFDACDACHK